MSQEKDLDRGHTNYLTRNDVNVDAEASVNEMGDVINGPVRKPRKLEILAHEEVYYPVVTFARAKILHHEIVNNETEVVKSEKVPVTETIVAVDNPKRRERGRRVWFRRLGIVIVTGVVVCAVALVGLRLAGFRTFTVMSGSMEPEYPVGALIYVQPTDYRNLKEGDVISYVANDDKTVVTHRVAEVVVDEQDSSVLRFRTKGDANASADAKLVHYKNVLGTPVVVIPYIGYLAHNIQQPPGIYIALVVGTLLLAWTFLPGTLEERRKTARKSVA